MYIVPWIFFLFLPVHQYTVWPQHGVLSNYSDRSRWILILIFFYALPTAICTRTISITVVYRDIITFDYWFERVASIPTSLTVALCVPGEKRRTSIFISYKIFIDFRRSIEISLCTKKKKSPNLIDLLFLTCWFEQWTMVLHRFASHKLLFKVQTLPLRSVPIYFDCS